MTRRPIVAGNWKMNATLREAKRITEGVLRGLPQSCEVEVLLCPPFTALIAVGELLKTKTGSVLLGAQDTHWEDQGAFTGEISPIQLKDTGCRYCIVGHSERRHGLGETDVFVHRKVAALLQSGLNAILCVGETLEQRQADRTWETVRGQLHIALQGIDSSRIASGIVIAYEPVWAIGTGQNATPAQAQEIHALIRAWLTQQFGKPAADSTRIQYGGSVKPDNAGELMSQPDVDGALVGGASLDPKAFIAIVEATMSAKDSRCSTGSS